MAKSSSDFNSFDKGAADEYAKLLAKIRLENEKLVKLKNNLTDGDKLQEELISEQYDLLKKIRSEAKGYIDLLKKQNELTKNQDEDISSIASSINSLPKMYEQFGTKLKASLSVSANINDTINGIADSDFKDITENFNKGLQSGFLTLTDLAQLNSGDSEQIKQKTNELVNQIGLLQKILPIIEKSSDLTDVQKQNFKAGLSSLTGMVGEAGKFANMSKHTKEIYGELTDDITNVGNKFRKVAATAEIFLSSGKNAVGLLLIGLGKIANKFSELGRNLGFTMTQMVGLKSEMLLMNEILGEASSEAVGELGKQLGGIGNVTSGMALDAGIMAYNFGLSGEEAGYLSVAFGKLQGQSYETGKNTTEFVRQLSLANGVAPSQVMKDIAHNTEAMALFSKDGGKNIGAAAVQAAKLGVNLSTTAKLAEHLLDYQSSVDDEMEASVLLGKQLNLGKARELAYNNDIAGATNEALKAVGGIGEWEKMSYYQRQATAKALGVSVEEMQQMISHQQDLNGMNGVGNALYSQSADTLSAIGNSSLGKITGGLGVMLTTLGNVNFGFQAFGKNMFGKDGAISGLLRWLGLMKTVPVVAAEADAGNAAVGAFTGVTSRNGTTKGARAFKTQQTIQPQTQASPKSFLDKVGSPGQILGVAAALLAFGAAILMISKAFQNFSEVTNGGKALGMFAAAIVGMGVAIIGISYALEALALTGALEVAAIGMLAFGGAILMIGTGIKLMGDGFATMTTSLNPLIALIPQLFVLALAFSTLAAAMFTLGAASIVALPALAVLGFAAGAGSTMLSGGKNDTSQQLLEQIVGLREDLTKGKVGVFLDGIKVSKELAVVKAQNKLAGS
jgi:hypothetical protein